jgi:hypothetical protein
MDANSVTAREKKLLASEDWILRKIHKPKRKKVTKGKRNLFE